MELMLKCECASLLCNQKNEKPGYAGREAKKNEDVNWDQLFQSHHFGYVAILQSIGYCLTYNLSALLATFAMSSTAKGIRL